MAPTPQDNKVLEDVPKQPVIGERVVISGMSGLYPDCKSVKDLADILYNKKDPITSERQRWSYSHPEVSQCTGKLLDLDRFDAQFFKVHFRLGNSMDSMGRKVLEQTYQAIYDAGVNPQHLAGKKVGVYIGTCFSETEKTSFYVANSRTGFGIAGCSKTMFANRISYWLNVKGPSMAIDEACCSSTAAIEQAYLAMTRGECEAAIVGGTNICLHPHSLIHHGRLLTICMDAKTKSFDQNADGCAKSEAINVLFLQKAENALRVYAEIVFVKTEFTALPNAVTGPKFGFCRDPDVIANFLKKLYENAGVSPDAVEYVEAFGSAVSEADRSELETIDKVFCNNRKDPLLVGSVMSNIGYSEAATGISSITKVLLGYETGVLAGNLHYTTPRADISGIRNGRIRVLSENIPFSRNYTAVNGISVTGVNSHVLLKGHYKPKDLSRYQASIPYLVTISGRQDSAVKNLLGDLKSRQIDPEEIALLHNIHQTNVSGHMGRGFAILDTNDAQKTICLKERAEYFDDRKRPLWFVYSGMGSQWPTMGSQLMRIPIFVASIERCRKVLEPKGVDIVHILTSPDKAIFDNILHSFVGIAAVQIGLTDILRALEIKPDKIIGHSVGELGCAYADGCLTAEEMILSAYSRGLVSVQTPFIRGSMAAVGIGHQTVSAMCPTSIEVACHNSSESSTISGPAEDMKKFVAELAAKGIFAKEVPCSNIAYHSRYIAEAGPTLLEYLKGVIKTPKLRSDRWLSTSIPQHKWNEPVAKYSSAEYHTNNLLGPVLFEETANLIPSNAVVIEIAPHGLLQAILKRSLHSDCRNIALTRKAHPDNVALLLEAVGNLYMEGYNPRLQELYPKVDFPVATGTPMLSHLVEWVHAEKWPLPLYMSAHRKTAASCKFIITIHDDENKYFSGNEIRGKTLFPFAAVLVAVWDTLAMSIQAQRKQISVMFREIKLFSEPTLHDQSQLRLTVALHRGTGRFEVLDEFIKVATGYITNVEKVYNFTTETSLKCNGVEIKSNDIYELLKVRDYSYGEDFQTIHQGNSALDSFSMLWNNNWVTLIDGLLQVNVLRQRHVGVSQPTEIRNLSINVSEHEKHITNVDGKNVVQARVFKQYETTTCGGVTLQGVTFHHLPHLTEKTVTLSSSGVKTELNSALLGSNGRTPLPRKLNSNFKLETSKIGDIHSLYWMQDSQHFSSEIEVKVHYASISRLDVEKAIGMMNKAAIGTDSDYNHFGFDFSGVTKSGERVMGIVVDGSCKRTVSARPDLLWPIPDHWEFEEAATVPMAYMTAFYCLNSCVTSLTRGRIGVETMKPDNILIHGGAGALGQALISMGLAMGYQVFTTVSDSAKKRFLMRLFPNLKEENIASSRNPSFGDMVLSATNGRGCNIVINCLKGELRNVSLRCSSRWTLDVSKYNPQDSSLFGMANLNDDRSYVTINVLSLLMRRNSQQLNILQKALSEGISRGYVRPLSRVTYAAEEVSRAFQLLVTRQHRGRVLLRIDGFQPSIKHRIQCNPDVCYVIFSTQCTFGIQLADRLIERGARNLFLHYDSFPGYLPCKIQLWKSQGVQVQTSCENINNMDQILTVLNNAASLGKVDGIIIDKLQMCEKKQILKNLELASKELFPSLRFFMVITDDNLKTKICLPRNNDEYPATILDLGALRKDRDISSSQINRLCVEAVEAALCSGEYVVIAAPHVIPRESLVQQLCSIAGLEMSEDSKETTTLRELGVVAERIPNITNYLRDYHNITLVDSDVSSLTLQRINEIEDAIVAPGYSTKKGLEAFYSYVDPDELLATTEMVFMPTLTSSATMRDDEFDVRVTSLCIVPGLEGHHGRFRALCERLKLPALVLQPGLDKLDETIQQTARRYANSLLRKSAIKNNFYILGYETGIFVALEITAILEEHGLTGTLFLLGGSPNDVLNEIEYQLQGFKTDQLEEAVARHMLKIMAREHFKEVENAFSKHTLWNDRVDAGVRTLLGHVSHSAQYARAQIEAACARLVYARRYGGPAAPLRSRLVLLRSPLTARSAPPEWQRLSRGGVTEHDLLAPLPHAAMDMRCATIINKYLDDEILDQFDKKNLCETYLLNADTFMSDTVMEES
ncbi:fatty acid synthase [Bombyx mori]